MQVKKTLTGYGTNKKIAFDIDGVLTDFEWFLNVYGNRFFSKRYHVNAQPVDCTTNKIAARFGYPQGDEKLFYIRYLFWYIRKMPIRENAAAVIHLLREQGNSVYLITARVLADKENILGKIMRQYLVRWLKRNHVEYDGIYYVSVENSAEEKRKICEKEKIDIMVEDDPDNIEEIRNVCDVICMDADYNNNFKEIKRALDFGEVYKYIHEQRYHELKVLSYQEREKMPHDKLSLYFNELFNYYKSLPFDKRYLKQHEKNIERFIRLPRVILNFFFHIKISEGAIPKDTKGTIFVCNHRRSLDIPICYCVLNKTKARILMKREYEEKAVGKLLKYLGVIFVKREDGKSGKSTQNLMIQTLLNDGNILLFPEGTRNRTNQILLPFKYGAVYMAQVTGAPIIPIIINRINRRKYEVKIGKSMSVNYLDDLSDKNKELQEQMKKMILTMK